MLSTAAACSLVSHKTLVPTLATILKSSGETACFPSMYAASNSRILSPLILLDCVRVFSVTPAVWETNNVRYRSRRSRIALEDCPVDSFN